MEANRRVSAATPAVRPGFVRAQIGGRGLAAWVVAPRGARSDTREVAYQLVLSGLLIGGLVGVTGMGGGSLLTPILVILFGLSPTTAIGTDILHGAVFKSVAAVRHRRLGTVQGRLSGWMLVGSAPASL